MSHITKRLQLILEHYELSASAFAESIGVQRSSISHYLKGRNKPSLEFVMKIVETYPEVDLYWLLYGKGSFPREGNQVLAPAPSVKVVAGQQVATANTDSEIDRIVVFFRDGTFKTYREKG
ncbi:helix-turn-helix domain-containing protein [Maribacter sp. 2307ULW6-5]|uniref:helix-turn-helix domain-containing protein n=1 Tax=Maribacter sp. 2307ULW6-5 TaxID=3386275 RepID=UPI0039BD2B10